MAMEEDGCSWKAGTCRLSPDIGGGCGGIVRDRGTWLVDKLGVTTHSHSFEENCGGSNVKNDVIG